MDIRKTVILAYAFSLNIEKASLLNGADLLFLYEEN
jgi:hypothetical protein